MCMDDGRVNLPKLRSERAWESRAIERNEMISSAICALVSSLFQNLSTLCCIGWKKDILDFVEKRSKNPCSNPGR